VVVEQHHCAHMLCQLLREAIGACVVQEKGH
jgi:hypothetical protein